MICSYRRIRKPMNRAWLGHHRTSALCLEILSGALEVEISQVEFAAVDALGALVRL